MRNNRTLEVIRREYQLIVQEFSDVKSQYLVWNPYPHWSIKNFNVFDWNFHKEFHGYNSLSSGRHEDWMDKSVTSYLNFLISRMRNLNIEANRVKMSKWNFH